MSKLSKTLTVTKGNEIHNIPFYTTIDEANGSGMYGTAKVDGVNAYYPLGLCSDNNNGLKFKSNMQITKNGNTYYMLTSGDKPIIVLSNSYYKMSDIYPDTYQTITEISNMLDSSNVTDMVRMFFNCKKLTIAPQLDTSNVKDMYGMFENCYNLATVPQLDTSSVTSMIYMFNSCYYLTTIPLLNTSNVTNMSSMFQNCSRLTSIPQLNTSKVTSMNGMFSSCSSLTSIPQLNTSKVKDMNCMFLRCTSLPSTFPWVIDCSSITKADSDSWDNNMRDMFYGSSVTKVTLKNVNSSIRSKTTSQYLKEDNTLTINFV